MVEPIVNIIRDIYSMDFLERKFNISPIISCGELRYLIRCFEDIIKNNNIVVLKLALSNDNIIGKSIKSLYYPIYSLLKLGKGIISLCGLEIIDIVFGRDIPLFKLYLHSCTIDLAEELLSKYNNLFDIFHDVLRDVYVIVAYQQYCIEISCKIYQNREEVLKSIGSNVIRHGYDPEIKYFGTLPAALILITGVFPINPYFSEDLVEYRRKALVPININGQITKVGDLFVLPSYRDSIPNYNLVTIYDSRYFCTSIIYILKQDVDYGYWNASNITLPKVKIFELQYYSLSTFSEVNLKEYFGETYETISVGISNDRYVALSGVKKIFNLNDDIFRLLCNIWLITEALDTYTKIKG